MAHFFCIFHALSFELNFFCDRSFPLTRLTAEFPQVAWRTSTRIILTANVDQHADWIFYEEYCLSQVLCMTDHLIIQLTYPEFHFELETEVDSLTGLQRYEGDYFEWILTIFKHTLPWTLNSLGDNFQLEMRLRFF